VTAPAGIALMAARMPENGGSGSLDYALRKLLDDLGGRLIWQHNSDSRRAHCGFPDWVLARRAGGGAPGALLVRELKRESTGPTPEQRAWLEAFRAAGIDAGIWRPSDLLSGRIARELAELAGLSVSGVAPC
jgi:hypothetical protein